MLIRQRQPRTKIDLNKRIKNVARTTFQKNAWYIVNTDFVFIFSFFFLLLWSKNVAQYSCVHAKQLSNATKPKAKGQKIDIDQNPKMYRRKPAPGSQSQSPAPRPAPRPVGAPRSVGALRPAVAPRRPAGSKSRPSVVVNSGRPIGGGTGHGQNRNRIQKPY